jgi:hypothetical protein
METQMPESLPLDYTSLAQPVFGPVSFAFLCDGGALLNTRALAAKFYARRTENP